MCNRYRLKAKPDEQEVYSIDECFLSFAHVAVQELESHGRDLRSTVMRWIGLPVGVGIAPTKTLAKLANHLAKHIDANAGVCVLADEAVITDALGSIELTDLWGVAGGFKRRLSAMGIRTPLQLRDADPNRVRKQLGVVGQRLVLELRGTPCIDLELVTPNKQNICCSRSFGNDTNRFDEVREAVCTFAAQSMVKLRRQDLAAGAVTVFVGTNIHAPPHVEQYHNSYGASLSVPSFDTREVVQVAVYCLRRIFRDRHLTKKAGVMLHRLCKREAIHPNLFDPRDHERSRRLMTLMDHVNRDHGRGTIRIGSATPFDFMPGRTVAWKGRSEHRSPRYTTRWEELPKALARGPFQMV